MSELPSLTYLIGGVLVPPVSLVLLGLLGLWLRRRRPAFGGTVTLLSLLGLLVLSLPATAYSLMGWLEGRPLAQPREVGDARAIVILAGGTAHDAPEWGGDTVNAFTLQRLRYGARLARQTGLPVLITGAAPREGRRGETEMMRELLSQEFGVDARWVDERARNTAGNAREAAALLQRDGIRRVVLVTSAFHMPRAQRVFEQAGLQVVPAPTGYFGYAEGGFEWLDLVPAGEALRVSYLALREMAAGLMYRVVDRR